MVSSLIGFGSSPTLGTLMLINLGLVAVLFAFLIAFAVRFHRRRYYRRIRLSSPRIDKREELDMADGIRWIAVIVILILVVAVILLMMFFAARNASNLEIPKIDAANNTTIILAGLSNEPGTNANITYPLVAYPEENNTEQVAEPEEVNLFVSAPIVAMPANATKLGERIGNFMATYAGYIIAGFIILVILLAALSSKKTG